MTKIDRAYNYDDADEAYTREGYVFFGWYVDDGFTTEYNGQTYGELAGDSDVESITLYANLAFYDTRNKGIYWRAWAKADELPSAPAAVREGYFLLRDVTLKNDDRAAGAHGPFLREI